MLLFVEFSISTTDLVIISHSCLATWSHRRSISSYARSARKLSSSYGDSAHQKTHYNIGCVMLKHGVFVAKNITVKF